MVYKLIITSLLFIILAIPTSYADTYALLVGINDYKDSEISDLNYSVNDVTQLYNVLIDPNIGKVPKANVYLMTDNSDEKNQPTDTNVLFRLEKMSEFISPDDTFIFHFSGHGMIRDGKQYLLSINSDRRSSTTLAKSAIPLEEVQALLKKINANQILIIVDACRNDPEKGKGDSDNILTDDLARGFRIKPKARANGMPGCSATFFASSLDERAYEWHERKSGVFTYYLVEGLKGKASDANNRVTLRGLAEYVMENVVLWSRDNLPVGKKQTPWLVSEGSADMSLVGQVKRIETVKDEKPQITIKEEPKITSTSKTIIGKDGAEMVLIPAGEFQMGSNDGSNDEKPVHTVYLDAFYIDKYEVTNAQYKKFMDATGYKAPYYWNNSIYNAPNQPVVGVDWNDASAYCSWAGKRLPTEAEWEKSARGGLVGKKYVWGDEWPPPSKAGNFDDETTVDSSRISGYSDGYVWTSPVGSFNPNGYGLYDMAGNVWEWCADWYDKNYYASSPKSNPTGPSSGSSRVLRGGSWRGNNVNSLRVAYRFYSIDPAYSSSHVGFRCVGLPVTP